MRGLLLILSTVSLVGVLSCDPRTAENAVTRNDSPIARGVPIKCSAVDYTWSGMLRQSGKTHSIKVLKGVNSEPLEIVLLEKGDGLMVDNQPFKVIRSNSAETFAVQLDERNLISVVVNYEYGTLLYNKVFTNADIGKQNSMSFVGTCKNY